MSKRQLIEENSFDKLVEMFEEDGADSVYLENYEPEYGIVTGTPLDSKSGQHWIGMAMISSIDEAVECKYRVVCDQGDMELVDYLEKNMKSSPKNQHDDN